MNFLPQHMQRAFSRERIIRLLAASAFSYFTLCVIAAALMVPTYLAVKWEGKTLVDQEKHLRETSTESASEASFSARVAKVRTYLPKEGTLTTPPLELLKEFFAVVPAGVVVQNWSYARSGGEVAFRLTGVGENPNALIAFRKAALLLPFVKDASYSRQFLTEKTNIVFSLSLTLK